MSRLMTRVSQSGMARICISSFIAMVKVVDRFHDRHDRLRVHPVEGAEGAFGHRRRGGGRNFRGQVYPGVAVEVHRLLHLLGLADWWEAAAGDDADDVRPDHRGVWLALLA